MSLTTDKIELVLKALIDDEKCTYLNFNRRLKRYMRKNKIKFREIQKAKNCSYESNDGWESTAYGIFTQLLPKMKKAKKELLNQRKLENNLIKQMSSERVFEEMVKDMAEAVQKELKKTQNRDCDMSTAENAARKAIKESMRTLSSPKCQYIIQTVARNYSYAVQKTSFTARGDLYRGVFEYVHKKDLDYLLCSTNGEYSIGDFQISNQIVRCKELDNFIEILAVLFAKMHISVDQLTDLHTMPETLENKYEEAKQARPKTEYWAGRTADVLPLR